jgi:hypothetical protein
MAKKLTKRKRKLIIAVTSGCLLITVLVVVVIYGVNRKNLHVPGEKVEGLTNDLARDIPDGYPDIVFTDVTEQARIDFQHFGDIRSTQLPEDMGSGLAWGDYDNDGWQDLFIVNFSGSLEQRGNSAGRILPHAHLYHNNQDGTFSEVSSDAGVDLVAFANGCAWGDFNNDGWLDLFISSYGKNYLFRNNGNGHFTDISYKSGIDPFRNYWTGIAIGDYNLDGNPDIYVCGYVEYQYSDQRHMSMQYNAEVPSSINPSSFKPARNLLLKNNGNGTFTEIAEEAGVSNENGRSLAAAWCDFNDDGLPDLYVANDVSDNAFFLNIGDGSFRDVSYNSFVADYRGAMGIGVGDWDNDGDFDMFITHWIAQENALYVNLLSQMNVDGISKENRMKFMDQAERYGLGQSALAYIGFSTFFFDYDNDSRLDLFIVNGSTFQNRDNNKELVPMNDQLLWNKGNEDGFFDVSDVSGPYFSESHVGRGGAYADYDNDGDLDVLVVNHQGYARLLRNDGGNSNDWIQVKLEQDNNNRFGIGAKLRLVADSKVQIREIGNQGNYLSQNSLIQHFGLGKVTYIDTLEITWPDGRKQYHLNLGINQTITISKDNQETDI